jgi:hypothetical protein
VTGFVQMGSDDSIDLVDGLMHLPLPIQDKILLRASLQQQLAHLARVVPWTQLEARTSELESRFRPQLSTSCSGPGYQGRMRTSHDVMQA